ncbi:DUF6301 family protein [Nocardia sp. CA-128927]|uniref:DUF6301 family protein n=1 Tax=Nocardia sp. CA-128927 TaxID=3239975 RepID=UPI003D97AF7B
MSASAKVDIEAAVEFFSAAVDFDWTWGVEDVQRFSQILGWKPADFGTESTVVMLTKARLEKPFATFTLDGRRIDEVTIDLTDFVESPAREFQLNAFAVVSTSLNETLGQPLVQSVGRKPKVLWRSANFIAELVVLNHNVTASVIRLDYWAIVDELYARGV